MFKKKGKVIFNFKYLTCLLSALLSGAKACVLSELEYLSTLNISFFF